MIRPGEPWGGPTSSPPDVEVYGGDADLATAVARGPDLLVRFRPDVSSDLARAIGLPTDSPVSSDVELPLDLLRVDGGPVAVNMIVIGTPPDALGPFTRRFGANVRVDSRPLFHGPCTTIVVSVGQFRRGLDVVPRGHPGDGRAEAQIYAVPARQRRQLRTRLATGTHVPHPGITQRTATRITVSLDRRVRIEVDGRPAPATDLLDVVVVPNAYRLLV